VVGAGAHALAYLRDERGLSEDTIKRFRLGYAPPATISRAACARAASEILLLEAKLIAPGKDGRESFDFFRDRVLFPILDLRGRPVAFGGRVMGDGEPKYLNSADGPLFHKGKQLYGLSLAREARRRSAKRSSWSRATWTASPWPRPGSRTRWRRSARRSPKPSSRCCGAMRPSRSCASTTTRRAAPRRCAPPIRALPELKPGFSLRFARLAGGKDPDEICRRDGVDGDARRAGRNDQVGLASVIWAQLVAGTRSTRRSGARASRRRRSPRRARSRTTIVRGQYEQHFREAMAALFQHRAAAADRGRKAARARARAGPR
jgi:DNA primase